MEIRESESTEPPIKLTVAERGIERQRRFDDADRYERIMETVASIVGGVLTTAFLIWRFSMNALGALVIGFLWGGLIYGICGWEHKKRRRRRRDRD
jgi:hypothetical protein